MVTWNSTRYTSQEVFDLEQRRIFGRQWMCVAHSSEVPEAGSFIRVDLGGENLLVVRNRDGRIRALVNLCRHRGAQLCLDDQGSFRRSIRCIYHGWTYDLDGQLVGVPWADKMPPGTKDRHLHTASATEWLGYIWINLDPAAAPLDDQVDPLIRARFGNDFNPIPHYGTEDLRIAHSISYDVQANWKILWENFDECYHCPTMHTELCAAVPQFRGGYGTVTGPQGLGAQLAEGATGFSSSGQAIAPNLPGVPADDGHTFYGILLWPNASLVFVPDHVFWMRLEPLGPSRTRVVGDWLFHPDAVREPGFDPADAVKVIDATNREDFEACERVQRGAHSPHFDDAQIHSPYEYRIAEFRRWVDSALSDAGASYTPAQQTEQNGNSATDSRTRNQGESRDGSAT
ncbi:aromatic ring-hydroxylating dioxygenase subunit alpha [Streptomyces sp. NPDC048644]|uniref:aromatic ring-hydroxylating oxygenase subunit alpha n=1 Tax=Streptomyces sp. NPDC048644 TaxID=3365582 RepID=UPI0037126602